MKKPDMLILVLVWEFLSAFIALIGMLSIAILVFPDATASMLGTALPGAIFGLSIGVLILISYIIVALTAAAGIIKNQEWGRVLGIVHAAFSVFAIPVGTVIGILIIVYLLRPDVEDYFKSVTK
jgi:hypothetical protein